jgi:hypothetical protein
MVWRITDEATPIGLRVDNKKLPLCGVGSLGREKPLKPEGYLCLGVQRYEKDRHLRNLDLAP